MRRRTLLVAASTIAIAAAAFYHLRQGSDGALPPTMTKTGEAVQRTAFVEQRTIDYEAIVSQVLRQRTSLLTVTVKRDLVRDQNLSYSIRYTPLPTSRARVRVKYHAEWPIGFDLGPGDFAVAREAGALVVTVGRPKMVARPSVRLLGWEVLESGLLVDEKTAVIELQQRIEPEAERRGQLIAKLPAVVRMSGEALTRFLTVVVSKASTPSDDPPDIIVRYR